eukprot:1194710-Prorocentrum_minimum.AAC.6
MWMLRPRLRYDGVYVSRNTYVKPGQAGWTYTAPVHLVVYYRYFAFRADGSLVYKTSPQPLRLVSSAHIPPPLARLVPAPSIYPLPSRGWSSPCQVARELLRTRKTRRDDHFYVGTWLLDGESRPGVDFL